MSKLHSIRLHLCSRTFFRFSLAMFAAFMMLPAPSGLLWAKELPMLVTFKDLLTEPDQYDGHRVVVIGRVRSIEVQEGRRGGIYMLLVLEEELSESSESVSSVKVVSLTVPPVREGHRALVQGVYHREGKAGGRPYEYFIEADAILKDP